jgi:hypothetical protein
MTGKSNDNKGLEQGRRVAVSAVRLLLNHRLASVSILLALGVSASAHAGPCNSPGDSPLSSDILMLSDAGVITAPVTTWPLACGD